jgi:hypothetical protein
MLCWEEHSATLKQLGNVTDISASGLGVLTDHSIPVGTAVTVSCPSFSDFALDGTVKHLSQRSDCNFIGIEFAGTSGHSDLRYKPELGLTAVPGRLKDWNLTCCRLCTAPSASEPVAADSV